MRSSAALLVGVLLAVSAVAGVGAGHPVDDGVQSSSTLADSSASPSERSLALTDPSTPRSNARSTVNSSANETVRDGIDMYVTVRENGDARWNVTARFVLEDDNETAAFRQLAQDYEAGTTDAGLSRDTFSRALDHAATDTERSMELSGADRNWTLQANESVGVLSLSFTWTNFGEVDGNRIYLGDAFWVGEETWLPSLVADQSMTFKGPNGYYVDSSGVPITNGTRIHFDGPRTFQRGDFAITYAPKRTITTPGETTTTPGGGFPDLSGTSGLLVVLAVFGIGFGAYAAAQRREPDPDIDESAETADPPTSAAVAGDAGDGGDESPTGREESDEDDEPPSELLSDEERVLRLLRDNGGRMKQADIVSETNWSNAKVSQLLSKMNDDDDVDKLRIGRENLITLPDEDVTDMD